MGRFRMPNVDDWDGEEYTGIEDEAPLVGEMPIYNLIERAKAQSDDDSDS
jgi:hypothetical protein